MRILVNTRFLLKDKLEGMGVFSHQTLQRMVRLHPEHEFIFVFDRPFSPEYIYASNVQPVVTFPPARHPYLYYIYFQFSIPRLLARHKADLFLSPDGFLTLRTDIPQVPVIHDLAFEHYPNDVSKAGVWYYTTFFPQFAARAKRIATVSNYSKKDIIEKYGTDSDKIDVVFNGAADIFKPVTEEIRKYVRTRFSNGHAYFLYVGAIQPRKNLIGLLKAFDQFKQVYSSGVKLLMVGRKAWKTQDTEAVYEAMKFKDDVVFTGRVSDEELTYIMGGALALTYVSFFEGFGIPILEAIQCGIPVICSNISSMPEVAGDAALLVDPFSTDSICEAMVAIAKDENLRERLVKNGLVQQQKFSWDKTAAALWSCVEKALPAK